LVKSEAISVPFINLTLTQAVIRYIKSSSSFGVKFSDTRSCSHPQLPGQVRERCASCTATAARPGKIREDAPGLTL